jgi:hypothetical protein
MPHTCTPPPTPHVKTHFVQQQKSHFVQLYKRISCSIKNEFRAAVKTHLPRCSQGTSRTPETPALSEQLQHSLHLDPPQALPEAALDFDALLRIEGLAAPFASIFALLCTSKAS